MGENRKAGLRSGGSARLATVTSLVDRLIERQLTVGNVVVTPGRELGNVFPPDGNSCGAYPKSPGDSGLIPEVFDGGLFEHVAKLSRPSDEMQPCLAISSLSLLSMKSQLWKNCRTFPERLQWAIDHAQMTQADLAGKLGISTPAMSEWFTGKVKNPKLRNMHRAAQFCKVHAWWLALGEGTPYDGIDAQFDGISGQDLLIAKGLSELADNSLRGTIEELIAARRTTQDDKKAQKKRKA